jgi:hypothetical protein
MTGREFGFVVSRTAALVLIVMSIVSGLHFVLGAVATLSFLLRASAQPSDRTGVLLGLAANLLIPLTYFACAHLFWHRANRIALDLSGEAGESKLDLAPVTASIVRGALVVVGVWLLATGLSEAGRAAGQWIREPRLVETSLDPVSLIPWVLGPLVRIGLGAWMFRSPDSVLRLASKPFPARAGAVSAS